VFILLPLSNKLLFLLGSELFMLERLHISLVDGKLFLGCSVLQPNIDHCALEQGSKRDLNCKGQHVEQNLGPSQQDVVGQDHKIGLYIPLYL
jgi:hypothetical protein